MPPKEDWFGKAMGMDPRLGEDLKGPLPRESSRGNGSGGPLPLVLRRRSDRFLQLFTPTERMVTVAHQDVGPGPDYLLVERFPPVSQSLPRDGWLLDHDSLRGNGLTTLDLTQAPPRPADRLPAVRDFPGHTRAALARTTRSLPPGLQDRLKGLQKAIPELLFEAMELPLLGVIGFGPGALPVGDMALCGMLLTGRTFFLGNRLRVHWLGRLCAETRRFLHRTTPYGRAFLRFALEGRVTTAQEKFFNAMDRDFEGAVELACLGVAQAPEGVGPGFLAGSLFILDLLRSESDPGHARVRAPGGAFSLSTTPEKP